jgi:hypothetical protein
MNTQLITTSPFENIQKFEEAQRMAAIWEKSTLVPKEYQNNKANVMIAMEMAHRIGAGTMQVMQNLYIVHGRPAWSSAFIIAAVNSCGRFEPLRFELSGEGDDRTCVAWTKDKENGERLEGTPITIKMAKAEGWYGKTGSKWQTMPEHMLRLRSASFFGRMYAPDVLMGMYSDDEAREMKDVTPYDAPQSISQKPVINAVDILNQAASATNPPHDNDGVIIEQSSDGERDEQTVDMFANDAPAEATKPIYTLEQLEQMPVKIIADRVALAKAIKASIDVGAVEKLAALQKFEGVLDQLINDGQGNHATAIRNA